MPLPVRNFQADLQRIAGSEKLLPPESLSDSGGGGTLSAADQPAGSMGNSPAGSPLTSGPTAARIVSVARQLLGTKNSAFYAPDPANACASFVSTVLLRAGATQGREQVVGPGFTRSAAGLTSVTEAAGAVLVGKFAMSSANTLKAQPGDIVQWFEGQNIGHSGIAIGDGKAIAIGSGAGHVETYAINYRGNPFTAFQLHRFTR